MFDPSAIWPVVLSLIKDWYAQIIAALIGMIIMWCFGLLQPKFQYNKRLNFIFKIKKVITKIDISIETKQHHEISEIKKKIDTFLRNHMVSDVSLTNNQISFFSKETGIIYKLNSVHDEELDKEFILIVCEPAFNVNFLGTIKELKSTINELQTILNSFNKFEKNKNRITTYLTIIPRWNFLNEGRMKVNYLDTDLETSFTNKTIKITNTETNFLEENITKIFYDWISTLL